MMNRRIFLSKTAMGVVVLSMPLAGCNSELVYDAKVLAEPHELSKIWDTETVLKIGKGYQEQFPKDTERALVKQIGAKTVEAIGQKIQEDFQTSNTIMLDGWVLSMTEAQQCALLSINQSKE